MATAILFDKSRAEYLVDCLANGTPIDGVRTQAEMLALAGACYFVASSHGPPELTAEQLQRLHPEHREAEAEYWLEDLHAAIEFYGVLTQQVKDGQYDEHFEPHVEALVTRRGGGKPDVFPVKGFRSVGPPR